MYIFFKRLFDILFSVVGLIVAFPIILICSFLIKVTSEGPIFFIQKRVGYNNKIFSIIKFRTMYITDGIQETDESRLTSIGKILRMSSIDEIPQLINIIKGDMSFIGPRPLPVQYLEWYTEREKKRHSVRPGISGWAQVNGRNNLTWKEKFYFDVFYVEKISMRLDFLIICKTIAKVIKKSDVVIRGDNEGEIDFDIIRKRERERDIN
ncbi:sugar transferase [Enterococcus gallinarum]|uniref:sugar transferase n=1 Tax=Enterococcus gallinarum TaxID=1353 RepID=UPI00288D97B6|nr:sugar transferase [Enterococcus gallinarum]MDT2719648.1 sugar transferase [Enterococcus gallinarum]